ncbi:MAG: ATP-binding protein [Hydrogenophaga sp.]
MTTRPWFSAIAQAWRTVVGPFLRDRLQRRILLAAGIVALLLVVLIGRSIRDASHLLTDQAASERSGQTQALVINLRESLNLADYTARTVRRQWLEQRQLRPHSEYVEDFPNFRDLILQVAIIGPDGWLTASSLPMSPEPVYLGDREHFRVHQKAQSDHIFISQLLVGRVSGKASVQFTRPILHPDGRFGGVVVLSLDADYLSRAVFEQVLAPGEMAVLLNNAQRVVLLHRHGERLDTQSVQQYTRDPFDTDLFPDHRWEHTAIEGYPLQLLVGVTPHATDRQLQRVRTLGTALTVALLLALLLYLRHITRLIRERTQLMQSLDSHRRRAESASQMKSRFVSGVSHELRTPLNGILGFAQLVEMADSLEEARRHGQFIHRSAQHLNELVNTLLDLSKIEAGQLQIVPQRVVLRDVLACTFALHQMSASQKGIEARLVFRDGLPEHICTDPTRLRQVLNNLLHNAVKFTETGTVRCKISRHRGQWLITVHDTGIGMDADQIAHIFQRFNNIPIDSPQGQAQQGSGLGLALTQELVTLLKGHIRVLSRKGRGTVVRVQLPDLPLPAARD